MKTSGIVIAVLALASSVLGRNIDLSTVPDRDTIQLTIYNAEDLTLVRETRRITFKQGVNPLQFSWANTLIDPTSVQLRFPKDADKLELLDTTYPHDKPQMLYWNVQSEIDGEADVAGAAELDPASRQEVEVGQDFAGLREHPAYRRARDADDVRRVEDRLPAPPARLAAGLPRRRRPPRPHSRRRSRQCGSPVRARAAQSRAP